jgi:SAM-dependent methyltransferase
MPLAVRTAESDGGMETTERKSCALCGANETELLFVGRDRLHDVAGEFSVVQCNNCSLVYLNPRPTWTEMEGYYPTDYAPYTQVATSPLQRLIRSGGLRRKQRLVQKQKSSGALLDVGCGAGDFIRFMAEHGAWRVSGIEPSAQAARRAEQISGAEVFCGRLEDARFAPHAFDVITMWHVMEHLYNPRDALDVLWRWLKPDGKLIVAVPVLDSIDARLFGPYWSGYDVPRHLFTYSKATLSEMLTTSGFADVRFDSFIGGYDAFRISLHFWSAERLESPRLRRIIRAVSQSLVLRLLMVPYFTVVNKLGCGSTLVATASPVE